MPATAKANRYRRHAEECLRLAQKADDPKEKDMLIQMAVTWRRLAEAAEAADT